MRDAVVGVSKPDKTLVSNLRFDAFLL